MNPKNILSTVYEKYLLRFDIGEAVYLTTDKDQLERIITGILIRPDGITYSVSQGTNSSWHYDFEMSKTKDVLKSTSS